MCLSHHALDLVTKSKGLIAARPFKVLWLNRCLGKIPSSQTASAQVPVADCLTRSLGLSARPLSLRLPLLHICWQGTSESSAQPCCLGVTEAGIVL